MPPSAQQQPRAARLRTTGPTAVVRRDSGNSGSTKLSEAGRIAAPPKACSTLAKLRVHTVGAAAESTAEHANRTKPAWKMRLRPIRSDNRPASGRNDAVPIMYPATPQATAVAVAPAKLARIDGSAMLVAVLLKPTSTVPSDATVSARHARPDTASRAAGRRDAPALSIVGAIRGDTAEPLR